MGKLAISTKQIRRKERVRSASTLLALDVVNHSRPTVQKLVLSKSKGHNHYCF